MGMTYLHFCRVHTHKTRHLELLPAVQVKQHISLRDGSLINRITAHRGKGQGWPSRGPYRKRRPGTESHHDPHQHITTQTGQATTESPSFQYVCLPGTPSSRAYLVNSHICELTEFPFFQLESQGQGWCVWAALDEHLAEKYPKTRWAEAKVWVMQNDRNLRKNARSEKQPY